MDLNIYYDASSSSSLTDHHHLNLNLKEPGELLEDNWFFGNLLDSTKTKKMSRSFSDPCTTSSNFSNQEPGKSYEETYEAIRKRSNGDYGRSSLLKTPSLPPRMEKKDRASKVSLSDPARTKKVTSALSKSSSLHRAPSLPNKLENHEKVDHHEQEEEEEESDFSMGKLIRQASLNTRSSLSTLPPRTTQLAPKGMTPSPTLSRPRSKKTPEPQATAKLESLPEMSPPTITTSRTQRPTHSLKSQKSLSYIESKQLQGFKEQYKPTLSRTMSSFQDKLKIDENDMYNPDAWLTKSASPPVPKWGGKKSKEDDVKAQIKFWARAVASNVRQEC